MTDHSADGHGRARRISVLGAGAWGTTLAILAAEAGHRVSLVAHRETAAVFMTNERRHPKSLPDIVLPGSIAFEHTGENTLADAEVVIVAIPTQRLRASLAALRPSLHGKLLLSAVKGLELDSTLRPSEVIRDVLGRDTRVSVLSGPNLSSEVAAGRPATTVIASDVPGQAKNLVDLLHSNRFRVYLSNDMIGVELGGALKNIIAIGAGIADGLDAGDNAKAAFMTRGIAEIARLGIACGAQPLTFAGLSGIGDLIATCASPLSRNHRVGIALAKGRSLPEILATMDEVAEGVPTTRAARSLGQAHGIDLPIVEQMYRVLFEGASPSDAIARLMEREPTHELLDLAPAPDP